MADREAYRDLLRHAAGDNDNLAGRAVENVNIYGPVTINVVSKKPLSGSVVACPAPARIPLNRQSLVPRRRILSLLDGLPPPKPL